MSAKPTEATFLTTIASTAGMRAAQLAALTIDDVLTMFAITSENDYPVSDPNYADLNSAWTKLAGERPS